MPRRKIDAVPLLRASSGRGGPQARRTAVERSARGSTPLRQISQTERLNAQERRSEKTRRVANERQGACALEVSAGCTTRREAGSSSAPPPAGRGEGGAGEAGSGERREPVLRSRAFPSRNAREPAALETHLGRFGAILEALKAAAFRADRFFSRARSDAPRRRRPDEASEWRGAQEGGVGGCLAEAAFSFARAHARGAALARAYCRLRTVVITRSEEDRCREVGREGEGKEMVKGQDVWKRGGGWDC